jgi:retron-type reverse transcriptase
MVSFIYTHMCFFYKSRFYMPHIKCYAFWKESHQTCDEYHVWKRWHNVDVKIHEKDEYLFGVHCGQFQKRKKGNSNC